MLILSRKQDERIVIDLSKCKPGALVEIMVVDFRGDRVRLGINAPREVTVHRKEIYDAIQRDKAAAPLKEFVKANQ
jgi:carbon storage regulator